MLEMCTCWINGQLIRFFQMVFCLHCLSKNQLLKIKSAFDDTIVGKTLFDVFNKLVYVCLNVAEEVKEVTASEN